LQRSTGIALGKFEGNDAHFFMDEAVGGEDDRAAELIRRALKIADFSSSFFDKNDAGSCVPTFQPKFPKTVEPAGSNARQIERGGTIASDAVRAQCEVVIVMNVGTRLALVNGKARA